ncbi:hypothetical protein [Rothia terrae]|uniref:hypothetical protein n=1 Tax=Rothia terrae TaxID=396015 RepID=UPI0034025941
MRTTKELYDYAHSTQELLERGHSTRSIKNRADAGELVTLCRGGYCERHLWEGANPKEKAILNAVATHKTLSEKVVFSHETAAVVQGLATLDVPRETHIVGRRIHGEKQGLRRHYHDAFQGKSTPIAGTPMLALPPGLTVLSCATSQSVQSALVTAESAVYSAGVPYDDLRTVLLESKGRGCRTARRVGQLMSPLWESAGETLVRFALLDEALPELVQQYEISVAGRIYRVDFALPELGIIIEFDGALKYTDYGPADQMILRERQREKDLQNAGWYVIRVGWGDVYPRPHRLLAMVRDAVERRSRAPRVA